MVARAVEQEKVQRLIKDAITNLCKMGFTYQSSLFIRAEVMVIVDNNDTVAMSVSEVVDNNQVQQATAGEGDAWGQQQGQPQMSENILHIKNEAEDSAALWNQIANWHMQTPAAFQALKQAGIAALANSNKPDEVQASIAVPVPEQQIQTSTVETELVQAGVEQVTWQRVSCQ